MTESFEALLEESLAGINMRPGELIIADVVEVNDDYVMVSAGLKSDAEIPAAEFRNSAGKISVEVGERVEVTLEAVEDGTGNTRMSRERAMRARAWDEMAGAFERSEIISGIITGKVKGGFTADVRGLRAFLPGSLVDVRPMKESLCIEGSEMEFKIIKLDQHRNNIVVSRRAIVENELSEEREKLLNTLEEGMLVKGVVKNLTDYGAFVNLGGLDGLLHITDMAWKRIKHPSEVLNVGDEVEARVLKFDRDKCRVSLGMKQLGDDPWLDLARRYPLKKRLFGRVTNTTDYGAFVELEEGVEGLVHLSEMDWTNKNIHPGRVCHIGDEVEVMVLDLDPERRRISLGMKQCKPNPWDEFAAAHSEGDVIRGFIRSITDFGVFIGVEGGIDGLVHLSDLSWQRPGEEVVTDYKKGDELSVVVLAVDAERERISLGLKQASEDPFNGYIAANGKGSAVQGVVQEVDARGAEIQLAPNVTGYLRVSELSRERVEDARSVLSVGDKVEAKVTSIERKNRHISLSVKVLEAEREGEAAEEYGREVPRGGVTLGDKLKAKFGLGGAAVDAAGDTDAAADVAADATAGDADGGVDVAAADADGAVDATTDAADTATDAADTTTAAVDVAAEDTAGAAVTDHATTESPDSKSS